MPTLMAFGILGAVAGQPLQADIYDRVTNVCCGDVGRTRLRLVLAQTLSTHPFGELWIGKNAFSIGYF
jgi:hypothetical protein